MATNLTADEARALATLSSSDAAAKPASVVARQFDQPLRLSANDLDTLRDKLRKALEESARDLASALRSPVTLELAELAEANAESLHSSHKQPFAALRFEVNKQPGWLVWDRKLAIDALEVALGATAPGANQVRALSPVESSTFVRLFSAFAKRVAARVGLEPGAFSLCQELEALGSWRQGGEKAEPQRLRLDIAVSAIGATSVLRLYLPGIAPAAPAVSKLAPQAPLPQHLGAVPVELKVILGAASVPLSDLLALEVGDVIPLDCETGDTLEVCVEDRACLRAKLGKSRGKLAVRIESIQRPPPGA